MTLIRHVSKDHKFMWKTVELSLDESNNTQNPYKVNASGHNRIHASAHMTIDEALEQMQELRDEVYPD
jgi:hypothetical protein